MNAVTFDTLATVEKLTEAGVERRQAEAIATSVRDAVSGGAATRMDIAELRADIAGFRADIRIGIAESRAETRIAIAECRAGMKVGIAECRAGTKTGIAESRGKIETGIAELRGAIETEFAALKDKIDAEMTRFEASMYRALWIQGAGIVAGVGVPVAISRAV